MLTISWKDSLPKGKPERVAILQGHIMIKYDKNFSKINLGHMDKVKKASRNAPLPYMNILAKFFYYFKGSSIVGGMYWGYGYCNKPRETKNVEI